MWIYQRDNGHCELIRSELHVAFHPYDLERSVLVRGGSNALLLCRLQKVEAFLGSHSNSHQFRCHFLVFNFEQFLRLLVKCADLFCQLRYQRLVLEIGELGAARRPGRRPPPSWPRRCRSFSAGGLGCSCGGSHDTGIGSSRRLLFCRRPQIRRARSFHTLFLLWRWFGRGRRSLRLYLRSRHDTCQFRGNQILCCLNGYSA